MKDKETGQALIETVFMLGFLLLLLFAIVETSRAWYLKNSLNNAARFGVRAAVVEPGLITDDPDVIAAVLSSPGVPAGSAVSTLINNGTSSAAVYGDTITVTVSISFSTFEIIPALRDLTGLSSTASMRYEL